MRCGLSVRVQPGARGAGLVGWIADGTLRLRVSEPPEGGRANRAVVELLAGVLGVPAAAVRVVRGRGARAKRVEVDGLEESEMRSRIAAALGVAGRGGDRGAREEGGRWHGR